MAINGIHHIALSTQDIELSLGFYQQLLGAEVVFDAGWEQGTELADKVTRLKDSSCRQVMLRMGNAYIELFEFSTPEPKVADPERPVCDHGWTHLCFDVTDVDSEYQRLSKLGIDFHCEPQWVSEGVKTTYLRDPDGNVVELQEVLPLSAESKLIGIPAFEEK